MGKMDLAQDDCLATLSGSVGSSGAIVYLACASAKGEITRFGKNDPEFSQFVIEARPPEFLVCMQGRLLKGKEDRVSRLVGLGFEIGKEDPA
jgi:hypothetical protein